MSRASETSSLTDIDSDEARPYPPLETRLTESPTIRTDKLAKTKKARRSTLDRKTITTATTLTNSITTLQTSEKNSTERLTESEPKRKRRKKATEPVMPLGPRIPSLLKIGAHVSAAKGVFNAIPNAVHIGFLLHFRQY